MRKWLALLCLVMVLLLAGCQEQATVGGEKYPVDITELDLSGAPLEDVDALGQFTQLKTLDVRNTGITGETYDQLKTMLPDCQIIWTPVFQGKAYPMDTTALTAVELTGSEAAELAYFPALQSLDATACREYDALLAILNGHPQLHVDYVAEVAGQVLTPDTKEAVFSDITGEDLAVALQLLPELENLRLEGQLPAAEKLVELQKNNPQVCFHWEVEICGVAAANDTVELDLSGIAVADVAQVEEKMSYLPLLETVIMCDCGVSNEEMDALNRRHEDVRFLWNITLGPYITVRTDLKAFISRPYKCYLNDEWAYNLRYCTEMVCLDLGHHNITHCEFVAFMPELKYLILADTEVSDLTPLTGLENLIFLEVFLTPVSDYSPLATLTALEDLNICYTQGKDGTPLMQMTWLKRLWWSSCRMSKEDRSLLRETLSNTEIVMNQYSSTGGGWRKGQNYFDMRDMLGMDYMEG